MSPDVIEQRIKGKWHVFICPVGTDRHDKISYKIIADLSKTYK